MDLSLRASTLSRDVGVVPDRTLARPRHRARAARLRAARTAPRAPGRGSGRRRGRRRRGRLGDRRLARGRRRSGRRRARGPRGRGARRGDRRARRDEGRDWRCSSPAVPSSSAGSPSFRSSATSKRARCLSSPPGRDGAGAPATPGSASSRETSPVHKKLILVVIDGLTPAVFERRRRDGRGACAGVPGRARHVCPGGFGVPLADAGLPVVARDGCPARRARHPAPRLVPPRRAQAGGVRLLVRGDPRRGDSPVDPRRDLQHERAAPRRRRRDRLRGARGGRPDDRGGELHVLPGADAPPPAPAGIRPPGLRPEALLLLQPLRVRRDRSADGRLRPLGRLDRRLRRRGRTLARDARRLRLPLLLPARLRLRVTRRSARGRPKRRSRGATRPSRR